MRADSPAQLGPFLSAAAVAALDWLRVDGAALSERSVRRWMDREGPGRLKSVKIGGKRVTCQAWIEEAITGEGEGTAPAGRTPTRRSKAIESAAAALKAEGF